MTQEELKKIVESIESISDIAHSQLFNVKNMNGLRFQQGYIQACDYCLKLLKIYLK